MTKGQLGNKYKIVNLVTEKSEFCKQKINVVDMASTSKSLTSCQIIEEGGEQQHQPSISSTTDEEQASVIGGGTEMGEGFFG